MFNELLKQLQFRNINWIGISRQAGLPRSMFSKHFGGHQEISPKNHVKIFHAILDVTGALVFDGRIWTKDDAGIILWLSCDNWDDQDARGIMDADDLSVYLGSKKESIQFWKDHYQYVKREVDRIDAGEICPPDSIIGLQVGQRQHCVDEANIAVERLSALGNFDLPKIN